MDKLACPRQTSRRAPELKAGVPQNEKADVLQIVRRRAPSVNRGVLQIWVGRAPDRAGSCLQRTGGVPLLASCRAPLRWARVPQIREGAGLHRAGARASPVAGTRASAAAR